MKKQLILILTLILISAFLLAGCTAANNNDLKQQLKTYQDENEKLKKENQELNQFKERVSFSLFKLESTVFYLNSEGYLPLTGSQVNDPRLFDALKIVKDMDMELEDQEIVLSIMPQEWSEDFNTILFVYDVYKPMLNGTETDAGKVSAMAGIFKNVNGKWALQKFTRDFKGDESFSIKNLP